MLIIAQKSICFVCALWLIVVTGQNAYGNTRSVIGAQYQGYQLAIANGDTSEIASAGEDFLASVDIGIESDFAHWMGKLKRDPVHTTGMFALGSMFILPVVTFNFIERGGKSEHQLTANTNLTGMDILLSKAEQRNFWAEMGDAYFATKQVDKAANAYEHCIGLEEAFRLTLAREDRRVGYFSNYDIRLGKLIAALFATGRTELALSYMELGKSKTLREGFLASHVKRVEKKSLRKILFAKAQIETIQQKEEFSVDELESLKRSITLTKKETLENVSGKTAFLMKNIVSTGIDLNSLDLLDSKTVMLNYYLADDALYAVSIKDNKIISSQVHQVSRKTLTGLVSSFNTAAKSGDRQLVNDIGSRLYDLLIGHFEPLLNGEKLLISPHGALHSLPFGALYDDGYLIERQPIGYIYSLSFLDLLNKRHGQQPVERKALRSLVMGNPHNNNLSAPELPGAESEAQKIVARLLNVCVAGETSAYLQEAASEDRFKKDVGCVNLLHLATHSKFDANDANNSFIMLADGQGQDGILYAGEIYELAVDQGLELIVMSSCESGALDVRPGDDPYGLPRAWFYAGAKRILSTYWPIDDESAGQLMDRYYYHFLESGKDLHKSLQLAKLEQLQQGNLSWIPFKIEGMWGEKGIEKNP